MIASFIRLLALAVSGYTAYVQRQQLRAQVWPHLELWYSDVNPVFSAINQGTGPARVTAMRVTVNVALVRTWWEVRKAAGITDKERLGWGDLRHAVLPPGKDFTVFRSEDDEQSRAKFQELLPRGKHALSMTVCYCSVLDDCWTTTLDIADEHSEGRSADSCPIPAARDSSSECAQQR